MGVPNMTRALSLSVFQHPQETKTILPLPAKAIAFDLGKLPTELVVTVMEQTADLPKLINLIFASDPARQAFIKYPKAFMPPLISNEHVLPFAWLFPTRRQTKNSNQYLQEQLQSTWFAPYVSYDQWAPFASWMHSSFCAVRSISLSPWMTPNIPLRAMPP